MTAAVVATALAAPFIGFAALVVFRALTAKPDTGRHRVTPGADQRRPHPATAAPTVPVVPGTPDPDVTGVIRVADMTVPVPAPRRQAPLSDEVTHLMDALVDDRAPMSTDVWNAAHREHWARRRVAAAGESWDTHMAKFDGTVLPRPYLDDRTRELDRAS